MLSHKTASWATEKKAIKEFPSVTNSDSKWKTNSETPRGAERRSERLSLVFSMMPPLGPDPTQHTIEFTFLPPFLPDVRRFFPVINVFWRWQTKKKREMCVDHDKLLRRKRGSARSARRRRWWHSRTVNTPRQCERFSRWKMKRSRKWPNSQKHELKRCLELVYFLRSVRRML